MRCVFFKFWGNFIHSLTYVKFANYSIIKLHTFIKSVLAQFGIVILESLGSQ